MIYPLLFVLPVVLVFKQPLPVPQNQALAPEVVVATADTVAAAGLPVAGELIAFAQTLKGTPYKYACSDPKKGFDCSGFVQYVFNRFQIQVPRSSIAFTNIGQSVDLSSAQPGDLILFTGTNASIRKVGHVGIITQTGGGITFIHASSGKAHGVTETLLGPHYEKRFIKVVRVR